MEDLSSVLPPLIFGTATFNTQYNRDPYSMDTVGLVRQALDQGIRAFDTSPYYGPSETLLGAALKASEYPRKDYILITKAGRIAESEFDYSPEWIRQSVHTSLERLHTDYLDLVYCHDVEFVSDDEVLAAVKELRQLRSQGLIRYVGCSGYPLETLCRIAERVLKETGEPLDAVMSYANYTIQNKTLKNSLPRLVAAGVKVIPNASILGMGLLRRAGPPVGLTDFHPAGKELRDAIIDASKFCDSHGERIEVVAIRYALETWLEDGSAVGAHGPPAWGGDTQLEEKVGVSVIGVSNREELTKTLDVWRSILDGRGNGQDVADAAGRWKKAHEWSLNRRVAIQMLADGVAEKLGDWLDFTWPSPPPDFVNQRKANVLPTPTASPDGPGLPERIKDGISKGLEALS